MRHPDYDVDLYDADLALLHLANPVNLTERIRPICLPSSTSPSSGDIGISVGVGITSEFGGTTNKLQETYIPLVPIELCREVMTYNITDNMLCAGFPYGMLIVHFHASLTCLTLLEPGWF